MSHYHEIVGEYLNAERHQFICQEFLIDIGDPTKQMKDQAFWVDVVAADFRARTLFLCEISYSQKLAAILRKFQIWSDNWDAVRAELFRASGVSPDWDVKPWVFAPAARRDLFLKGLANIPGLRFAPEWTALEDLVPWKRKDAGQVAAEEGRILNSTA